MTVKLPQNTTFLALFRVAFCLITVCLMQHRISAALTLTQAGIDRGFSLSTFASGFSNNGSLGPLGIEFNQSGKVLITTAFGQIIRFDNVDNQTAANGTVALNTGGFYLLGLANLGSQMYVASPWGNGVYRLNQDGTAPPNNTVAFGGILHQSRDLVANAATGHLFVSGLHGGIHEVNPAITNYNTSFTQFATGDIDGLAINADFSVLYAAFEFGQIKGYSLQQGTYGQVIYDSGLNSVPGADGLALGTGSLAGKLYANSTNGKVYELDLTGNPSPVIIAEGNSRGDLVKVDPSNGTLLLTQTTEVLRLAPPVGGGFVGGPAVAQAAVPEPASLTLWGIGALALGIFHRRRQRAA